MAKKVPFTVTSEVRDCCLCLHTQRAARALARRFDEALRPVGLTNGQYSLLHALNRDAPPAMGAIARFLAMDRTTLTAMLKPLERDMLVKITPDPDDRRSRLLQLTEKGHRRLLAALPIWRQMHGEIEAALLQDANELRAGLRALA